MFTRYETNSSIGVLLKLSFRDVFQDPPLFLPGPFWDSVFFRYFILFMKKSVNKWRKHMILTESVVNESQMEENPSGMPSGKPYLSVREPSRTAAFE